MTNSSLNLRTWSKLLARFNIVVGRVVGKLSRFVGFDLGNKLKGFCLGQFMPKPKFKETMEVFEVTSPVSDLEVGLIFAKCFQRLTVAHGPEMTLAVVSGVDRGLSTSGVGVFLIQRLIPPRCLHLHCSSFSP
jgi:hypothetical protein